MERKGIVTFKGNPLTLREIVPELTNLPDFICPLAMAKKLSG